MRLLREVNGPRGGVPELNPTRHRVALATSLLANELWNVYLPPFKAAIDAGAGNIMTAYMGLNGVPASSNEWLLTTVLRETWGFKGFVVSDSGAVWSLMTQGVAADPQDTVVRAVKAGIDMEMARIPEPATMRTLPVIQDESRFDVWVGGNSAASLAANFEIKRP